nr:MAG TPA: hypothetical protein [Caudoviricetes sp.]
MPEGEGSPPCPAPERLPGGAASRGPRRLCGDRPAHPGLPAVRGRPAQERARGLPGLLKRGLCVFGPWEAL